VQPRVPTRSLLGQESGVLADASQNHEDKPIRRNPDDRQEDFEMSLATDFNDSLLDTSSPLDTHSTSLARMSGRAIATKPRVFSLAFPSMALTSLLACPRHRYCLSTFSDSISKISSLSSSELQIQEPFLTGRALNAASNGHIYP
jgi:hypothetical protein